MRSIRRVLLFAKPTLVILCVCFFLRYLYDSLNISTYHLTWSYFKMPFFLAVGIVGIFIIAHILMAYSYFLSLKYMGCLVDFQSSWFIQGFALPGKYLPGKIWLVAGTVVLLKRIGVNSTTASFFIGIHFFTTLCASFALGLLALKQGIQSINQISGLYILVLIVVPIIMLHPKVLLMLSYQIEKYAKKNIYLTGLSFKQSLMIIFVKLVYFVILGIGYLIIVQFYATQTLNYKIEIMASFPLALTAGLLAFVLPAGIGVREYVLMSILKLEGISDLNILVIIVSARFWTIIGEAILFVTSILLYNKIFKKTVMRS